MNLTAILIVVVAWGASLGGAFFYGENVGEDRKTAQNAREDDVRRQTKEDAMQGAAAAIAANKPINRTIVQRAEKEIYENVVYRDCRVPASGVQLANEAITGRKPEPAGSGKLPGTEPAK